jgi:hypothetical protein
MLCHKCNQKRLEGVRGKKTPKPIANRKKTGERALFESLWETRAKVSFLSGKDLSRTPDFLMLNIFAHVLPKGKYPKYRLNTKNIIFLDPDEHYLLDFGTEDQRQKYAEENNCDWDCIYNLAEKLKKEYGRL